ncbi:MULTISPECIES: IS6 family transposase [Kordiimonas]|jgi:putative transposase|uniref:IS6 family transposase n=1 Tax=Kordiimonas TaxID=288021 RepID=UPI00257AF4BE|nr:IS6 family transposase [Kordiimonas sp. UBA4487]
MKNPFRYFKYSPDVIRLAVMLYVRFPLSLRQVEDLLHERGIDVSHETIRYWWNRFGPLFASAVRKKRLQSPNHSNWRWHLDEVFVKVDGERRYLWRAVDHEGEVLDAIVTQKRDKKAALKLLKRLMKRFGKPKKIVTDRLRSYSAALKAVGCEDRQEVGRWRNNRAENSHQPFRRKERSMQGFKDPATLQKFTAIHGQIYNHFNAQRHLTSRQNFRDFRAEALTSWRQFAL